MPGSRMTLRCPHCDKTRNILTKSLLGYDGESFVIRRKKLPGYYTCPYCKGLFRAVKSFQRCNYTRPRGSRRPFWVVQMVGKYNGGNQCGFCEKFVGGGRIVIQAEDGEFSQVLKCYSCIGDTQSKEV